MNHPHIIIIVVYQATKWHLLIQTTNTLKRDLFECIFNFIFFHIYSELFLSVDKSVYKIKRIYWLLILQYIHNSVLFTCVNCFKPFIHYYYHFFYNFILMRKNEICSTEMPCICIYVMFIWNKHNIYSWIYYVWQSKWNENIIKINIKS